MPQSNGYFKFNKQFLEPVPFPCQQFIDNDGIKTQLSEASQRIELLQDRFLKGSPNQQRSLARLLVSQWDILDNLCYELYNLQPNEIDFFRTRGRNINRIESLK